jgi:hypothetical protein
MVVTVSRLPLANGTRRLFNLNVEGPGTRVVSQVLETSLSLRSPLKCAVLLYHWQEPPAPRLQDA